MDKETKPLFKVADVFDVYADAFVSDRQTGNLLFASFWGRDTSLQELLARLIQVGRNEKLRDGRH